MGRLEAIAAKASRILWAKFEEGWGARVLRDKGDDVTREIDVEMEEYIYRALRSSFEGGLLIAEEGGPYRWGDERYVFVLDPLDGSLNYALGIPIFAISLAGGRLRSNTLDDLEYGVLAVPYAGSLYSVGPGTGAMLNGSPISRRDKPANVALVAAGEGVPGELFAKLVGKGLKIRSLGCSSVELLMTALGAAAAYVDIRGKLRALDVAASLLLGKALGLYYVIYGDYSLDARGISIIAGERSLVDELRGLRGGG